MRSVKRLTVAAMLAALGLVLLYLGAVFGVLDLVSVMLASLLVAFAVIELGGAWPYLLFGVTSLIALLLLPDRFVALEYACFGGYYPILKYYWERLPRLLSGIGKGICFLLAAGLLLFLGIRLFGAALPEKAWYLPLSALFALAVFYLYDLVLTRLIVRYCLTVRPRISRMLK
jgi:hypothetical protein